MKSIQHIAELIHSTPSNRTLRSAVRLYLLLGITAFLSACMDPPPKPPCDEIYGHYLSVAPNGDLAASYCKKGQRGILLRTQAGEEWLAPPAALYTTPAFSPDGSVLLFTQIDFTARTSALYAYDLSTKTMKTLVQSTDAISFSALTQDKKVVYFWAGKFRQSGMTGAADFSLHRLSLSDGKDTVLDGPYFIAYNVSVDESGGAHYAYDGTTAKGGLVAKARKISRDGTEPIDLEFPDLGGDVIYTTRGYYRVARGFEQPGGGNFKYCIVGAGLTGDLCKTKSFSISLDGRVMAYFDAKHQIHVEPVP